MKKLTLEELDSLTPEALKEYASEMEIGEKIDLYSQGMDGYPLSPVRFNTLRGIYNQMISEMCGIMMHQADIIALTRPSTIN